jgi:hypothetical protein
LGGLYQWIEHVTKQRKERLFLKMILYVRKKIVCGIWRRKKEKEKETMYWHGRNGAM